MRKSRKRTRTRWFKISLLTVELIGLGLSIFMLLISLRLIYTKSEPCPRSRIFKCHSVMRGKYSKVGPVINVEGTFAEPVLSATLRRPVKQVGPFSVAGMGALYFAFQIALTFLAAPKGNWASRLKFASAFCGLAFLAYLRAIEILWLHGICPWCYGAMVAAFVEAFMIWRLNVPPLPRRWGFGRQLLAVFGMFIVMIALCTAALWLNSRLRARAGVLPTSPEETPAVGPTPTPQVLPHPPASTTSSQAASTTGAQTPAASVQLPVEPVDPATDTVEKQILRQRGWKILSNPKGIRMAGKLGLPVVLLVFDPDCEECQGLIGATFSDPQCDDLEVTKVAIEISKLGSELPDIRNVPTIVIYNSDGKELFRYEGQMDVETFIRSVEMALSGKFDKK